MLVICNGLPRSGSTAMFNLIRSFIGANYDVSSLGFFNERDIVERQSELMGYMNSPTVFIMKTHYKLTPEIYSEIDRLKIIELYTLRDLSSIAASMRRVWNYNEQEIMNSLDEHVIISTDTLKRESAIIVPYEKIFDADWLLKNVIRKADFTGTRGDLINSIEKVRALAESSKNDRFLNFKARWSNYVGWLNQKLKLGSALRRVVPSTVVARIRDRLLLIDRDTMFHPGHVGKDRSVALQEDYSWVSQRYANWYSDFSKILADGKKAT